MAGEDANQKAGEGSGATAAAVDPLAKVKLTVPVINSAALVISLVFIVYSKLIFKRQKITDGKERIRLSRLFSRGSGIATPIAVNWKPITVNISSSPVSPKPANGTSQQLMGKLHYVTVGISLELRNRTYANTLENLNPVVMDRLLSLLAKKTFQELNNIQGRYILSSQIIDTINQLVATQLPSAALEGAVSQLYFTQFIIQ